MSEENIDIENKDEKNIGFRTALYFQLPIIDDKFKEISEGLENMIIKSNLDTPNSTPRPSDPKLLEFYKNCISSDLLKRLEENSPIKTSNLELNRKISEIFLFNCDKDSESEQDQKDKTENTIMNSKIENQEINFEENPLDLKNLPPNTKNFLPKNQLLDDSNISALGKDNSFCNNDNMSEIYMNIKKNKDSPKHQKSVKYTDSKSSPICNYYNNCPENFSEFINNHNNLTEGNTYEKAKDFSNQQKTGEMNQNKLINKNEKRNPKDFSRLGYENCNNFTNKDFLKFYNSGENQEYNNLNNLNNEKENNTFNRLEFSSKNIQENKIKSTNQENAFNNNPELENNKKKLNENLNINNQNNFKNEKINDYDIKNTEDFESQNNSYMIQQNNFKINNSFQNQFPNFTNEEQNNNKNQFSNYKNPIFNQIQNNSINKNMENNFYGDFSNNYENFGNVNYQKNDINYGFNHNNNFVFENNSNNFDFNNSEQMKNQFWQKNFGKNNNTNKFQNSNIINRENNQNILSHPEFNEFGSKFDPEEYIVEMFGKRGWICDSCNNFNYESNSF